VSKVFGRGKGGFMGGAGEIVWEGPDEEDVQEGQGGLDQERGEGLQGYAVGGVKICTYPVASTLGVLAVWGGRGMIAVVCLVVHNEMEEWGEGHVS
jgi:hypothetical protein